MPAVMMSHVIFSEADNYPASISNYWIKDHLRKQINYNHARYVETYRLFPQLINHIYGDEQSGQIQQIGFSLYTDLLSKTIEAMKQQGNVNLDEPFEVGVDINLRVPCLLPANYVPDVQTRLILYKRISIADENGLNDIKIEMIDRFGLIPKETEFLFRISLLKRLAKKIGLKKISANNQGGSIHFADNVNIENSTL